MSNAPNLKAAAKHFDRRARAARTGDHFPSEEDLLLGMPFLLESLETDSKEFALRLERRLQRVRQSETERRLVDATQQLSMHPSLESVRELQDCLRGSACPLKPAEIERITVRLQVYQACLGDAGAAFALASEMALVAILCKYETEFLPQIAFRALNLLCLGGVLGGGLSLAGTHKVSILAETSKRLTQDFKLEDNLRIALALPEPDDDEDGSEQLLKQLPGAPPLAPPEPIAGHTAVVIKELGNPKTIEGRRVAEALSDILGKPLPLTGWRNRSEAWHALIGEFPYAAELIDDIFRRLKDRPWIVPTILVGAPGSGKSRFARRLAFRLGLRFDNIQFGGMSDSSIMGTARRWSTGEPSIAVSAIQRHKVANPALVLDEVEKASDGGHNGNALHALLAMLEPDTAVAFHDPWVQAPVNIGYVSWLMTANSLEGISMPLRDRCRIIRFPSPGLDDLPVLGPALLAEVAEERGDLRQLPLDGVELQALAAAWTDRSLRTLRKMIEHVLDDRDRTARKKPM